MDPEMAKRIAEMSEEENAFETAGEVVWNRMWLIQARQAVLLERILAKLERAE